MSQKLISLVAWPSHLSRSSCHCFSCLKHTLALPLGPFGRGALEVFGVEVCFFLCAGDASWKLRSSSSLKSSASKYTAAAAFGADDWLNVCWPGSGSDVTEMGHAILSLFEVDERGIPVLEPVAGRPAGAADTAARRLTPYLAARVALLSASSLLSIRDGGIVIFQIEVRFEFSSPDVSFGTRGVENP